AAEGFQPLVAGAIVEAIETMQKVDGTFRACREKTRRGDFIGLALQGPSAHHSYRDAGPRERVVHIGVALMMFDGDIARHPPDREVPGALHARLQRHEFSKIDRTFDHRPGAIRKTA